MSTKKVAAAIASAISTGTIQTAGALEIVNQVGGYVSLGEQAAVDSLKEGIKRGDIKLSNGAKVLLDPVFNRDVSTLNKVIARGHVAPVALSFVTAAVIGASAGFLAGGPVGAIVGAVLIGAGGGVTYATSLESDR